jgi:hypothetical protein
MLSMNHVLFKIMKIILLILLFFLKKKMHTIFTSHKSICQHIQLTQIFKYKNK